MKTFLMATALACSMGGVAHAAAIDLVPATAAPALAPVPSVAVGPAAGTLTLVQASELPEPAVFAMMLLGLVLIGYRASRDSSDTFK